MVSNKLGVLVSGLLFKWLVATSGVAVANEETAPEEGNSIRAIEWNTSIKSMSIDTDDYIGQRFILRCLSRSAANKHAVLSGTDTYSSDSALCLAAVHAGLIDLTGGPFTVQLNPGIEGYSGSARNGITSEDFPKTSRSIMFVKPTNLGELNHIQRAWAPRVRWDTKFTRSGLGNRTLLGQSFVMHCPPTELDLQSFRVYGTDSYAFDSFVCPAAVHAGRLTPLGGFVRVAIEESFSELRGSIRNGIESRSGGTGRRAISFHPILD